VSCSEFAPADTTAPTSIKSIALSVQPDKVEPEFLPAIGGCTGARAFRTRFVVVAGGMQGFVVQELRVSFNDRFGVLAVPTVLSAGAAQSGSLIPSSPPVPLPTSMPIPIPSTGPNNGLSVFPGGSQQVPVALEFGWTCVRRERLSWPSGPATIAGDRRRIGSLSTSESSGSIFLSSD
jgi:hypothetical protein